MLRCSFTPKSVKHWKPSITSATITAKVNHAFVPLPMASVIAPVTGRMPTTTANMPTFAQMRANAPMRSRSFWSSESAGIMDQ